MSCHKEHYRKGANLALAGYQLIESLLKTYIKNYFSIVKSIIGNELYFGFDGQDYEEAPLGRLLQVFSKICDNQKLVKDLQSEIKHRNDVAHKSMLILYSKSKPSIEEFDDLNKSLEVRNKAIHKLYTRLIAQHDLLVEPYEENISAKI